MKKLLFGLMLTFSLTNLFAQDTPIPTNPPKQPAKDSVQLGDYTAKYKFAEGSPVAEITIVIENGTLMAQTAMGNSEFKKTDTKDVFTVVAYSGTATFKRNEAGKVTGVLIQVNDMEMEGVRDDKG